MKPFLVIAAGLIAISLPVEGSAEVKPTRPLSARNQPRLREPLQVRKERRGSADRSMRRLNVPVRRAKPDDLLRSLISSPVFPPEIWLESRPNR